LYYRFLTFISLSEGKNHSFINDRSSHNILQNNSEEVPTQQADEIRKPALFLGAAFDEQDPHFDPIAKQDMIDEHTVNRIEQFKEKYEEAKDEAD